VSENRTRTYLCIDLKSFYASVECADRGLDPFTTNLVVADPERSENTICLAITPAMKARGVRNRCRMRDIPEHLECIIARPRMHRYLEVSTQIVRIYLRFVAAQDVHVYSVDECFIDATPYLRLYRTTPKAFANILRQAVFQETGITATAGIGTNLFLAKVALDITAKHADDGIGVLDEDAFRREIWFHQPLTDIWGIGPGITRRLAKYGAFDLAGVCALRPVTLRREFGKNAEWLIDHAWGLEPCTIADINAYTPRGHSLSNGQVLMRDYSFAEARTILREMTEESALELFEGNLACTGVAIYIGYAKPFWTEAGLSGYGGASRKLPEATNDRSALFDAVLSLYDANVDPAAPIRRVNVALCGLIPESEVQPSLFGSPEAKRQERKIAAAASAVRGRFGANALLHGTSLLPEANARERNQQIGGHHA
jgi:DNA polymerase V